MQFSPVRHVHYSVLLLQVFVVDCRNHGLSPHEDEMDYRVMSKDIAKLLTDENVGPVDMIGHSMGGKVAMMYALSIDLVSKNFVNIVF